MTRRTILPLLLLALLGPAPLATADPTYELIPIGTLGGTSSFALDVNRSGQVTGNAAKANGRLSAIRADGSGAAPVDLGRLPNADADFSRGYSINDAGKVVGESSNETSRAFLFVDANGNGVRDTTPVDEMTDLGTLGGSGAVAHGINNRDQVVGGSSNGQATRAFLWQGGTMRDLGSLDGLTNTPARAWGLNDAGQVVGLSRTGVGTTAHAFLFTDANGNNRTDPGEMVDLDATGGSPSLFSQAFRVNEAGHAVGEASVGTTPSGTSILNPILWRDGSRLNLGTLGSTFGSAKDINASDWVVGNVTNISGSPQRAFLWRPDAGIVDLNSLISPSLGWTLRSAEGINDRGDIVGFGTFNGQTRAYLLRAVPEPGAMTLLAIGAGVGAFGVAGRGRRAARRRASPR